MDSVFRQEKSSGCRSHRFDLDPLAVHPQLIAGVEQLEAEGQRLVPLGRLVEERRQVELRRDRSEPVLGERAAQGGGAGDVGRHRDVSRVAVGVADVDTTPADPGHTRPAQADQLGRAVVQAVDDLREGLGPVVPAVVDLPRAVLVAAAFDPVEERFIVDAERTLGVRFPAGYRSWLRRQNGGEVQIDEEWWDLHPVADASDPRRIGPTWDHVCRQTELSRLLGGFPADAVAIGDDGSGDLLVLKAREPGATLELAVWQHATAEVVWTVAAVDVVFTRG